MLKKEIYCVRKFLKLRRPLYLLTTFSTLRIRIISANTVNNGGFMTSDRLEMFVGFYNLFSKKGS